MFLFKVHDRGNIERHTIAANIIVSGSVWKNFSLKKTFEIISGMHLLLILMACKLDIGIYKKSCHDKDIKMFSEGFELYIHNSSIIEGKNDQPKDSTG